MNKPHEPMNPHVAAMMLGAVLARIEEDPAPETYAFTREEILALYTLLRDWTEVRTRLRMY